VGAIVFKVSVTVATTLLLCGCAGGGLDSSSTAVKVATALPPPDSPTLAIETSPYLVAPGDDITVSVFGAPEMTGTGIVDVAGNFAMPLAGSVRVGGLTPEQVAAAVQDKLRGPYLKNPKVAVSVKQSANRRTVTIDGAVQQPGIYPVVGKLTLQQAIATARGAAETANIRNVVVFRTVDNQKMAAMFDLKDIRSGRSPDPQIFGNDIVVVGESAIQKFLRNTQMAFPVFGRFIPMVL
jgi:polysaccharide export outer membrane protein